MNEYNINIEDDLMIKAINMEKEKTGYEIAGIELKDGKVITGKEKEDITKTAGVILNILKIGTDILEQEYLIPKEYIKKVFELKEKISEEKYVDITECLIILTILSNKSGKIQKILGNLEKMKDLRYYSTSIIPEKERVFLKSLNIDILYNIQKGEFMKNGIEEKNIYSNKKESCYILAKNLIYIYIILCPIFDMISYIYRNYIIKDRTNIII